MIGAITLHALYIKTPDISYQIDQGRHQKPTGRFDAQHELRKMEPRFNRGSSDEGNRKLENYHGPSNEFFWSPFKLTLHILDSISFSKSTPSFPDL